MDKCFRVRERGRPITRAAAATGVISEPVAIQQRDLGPLFNVCFFRGLKVITHAVHRLIAVWTRHRRVFCAFTNNVIREVRIRMSFERLAAVKARVMLFVRSVHAVTTHFADVHQRKILRHRPERSER